RRRRSCGSSRRTRRPPAQVRRICSRGRQARSRRRRARARGREAGDEADADPCHRGPGAASDPNDPRTIALLLVVPSLLIGLVAWIFDETDVFASIGPAMLALFPFIVMFLVTSIATLRER